MNIDLGFIIAQILGVVIFIVAIASVQLKKMSWILICNIIMNGAVAIQCILRHENTVAVANVLATILSIILAIFDGKEFKSKKVIKSTLLIAYYIAVVAIQVFGNWENFGIMDLIPILATLTFVVGVGFDSPKVYRMSTVANAVLWSAFDIYAGLYTNMLTRGMELISCGTAILRLDLKVFKNKKKDNAIAE